MHLRQTLCLLLLATALTAGPARAQYLYLDANGDGVRTDADVLHPTASTAVDIWLVLDRNRDGSVATCSTAPSTPLNFFSYGVCLRAVGGTVAYADFVNQMGDMPISFGTAGNDAEFFAGRGGPIQNPPGAYRLGSLSIRVVGGTPSIAVVAEAPTLSGSVIGPAITAFGSPCPGLDFDSTLKLGRDWFDADGLPLGTSSPPNTAPVLVPPADMTVPVGSVASQLLQATDADGMPLTFSRTDGPLFVDVQTVNPGRGFASGVLYATPIVTDVGVSQVTVDVSDGQAADSRSLRMQVVGAPNHTPRISAPTLAVVVAGSIWTGLVSASDVDGELLTLTASGGPAWAEFAPLVSRPGTAVGRLSLHPDLCDAGPASLTLSARDGSARVEVAVSIDVHPPSELPTSELVTLATRNFPSGIAGGDLNGDGLMDILVANEFNATFSVFITRRGGGFSREDTYDVGDQPGSAAVGDFNGDGALDAAVTSRGPDLVSVFLGRGDGALRAGATYGTGPNPEAILAADMNRDGRLDLVVANGGGSTVSVLIGNGDGTFAGRKDAEVVGPAYGVAAGDWNEDGRPDLAVANAFSGSISFLSGRGDGTFTTRRDLTAGRQPFSLAAGDWNGDGHLDLGVADFSRSMFVLLGDGSGGFSLAGTYDGFDRPQGIATGDMDGDGNADLVLADLSGRRAQVLLGRGDGSFAPGDKVDLLGGAYGVAIGDMNGDAIPDLALSDYIYGAVMVRYTARPVGAAVPARAFVPGGRRPVPGAPSAGPYAIRIEPAGGAFALSDLDLASFALASPGTGSVEHVPATPCKNPVVGDLDHDGVEEITVCFLLEDLAPLFDQVSGRRTVVAHLEGSLRDGRPLCAAVVLEVLGSRGALSAELAPNPLNPRGVLTVTTSRLGRLSVRLYDIQGRLVRTLIDSRSAPAGPHELVVDGKDDQGRTLASGVYLYEIEAEEGTKRGRVTVLK